MSRDIVRDVTTVHACTARTKIIHRVPKSCLCHQTHGGNFVKSQPIFKILSPLKEKEIYNKIISHRTLSVLVLPH